MNCKDLEELLDDYVDGVLAPEQRTAAEAHLERCAGCREEVKRLRSLLGDAYALLKDIPPPHDLWPSIAGRLGGPPPPASRRAGVPLYRGKWGQLFDVIFGKTGAGALRPAAAVAAIVVIAFGLWAAFRGPYAPWNVARVEGTPLLGLEPLTGGGRLDDGAVLQTDAVSRARMKNAVVGTVDVGPNSRFRLLRSRAEEQRFALERGTIQASTWVPPRVFVVETPSAVAFDLGCEYRLAVDESGRSLLLVTAGCVSLEGHGRESIVPAAAMCQTRPGSGPGTPLSEHASGVMIRAVERFDFDTAGAEALTIVLASAQRQDAVTLWHLLSRAAVHERGQVIDALARLVPLPPGATRDGIMKLDRQMLERWWEEFEPMALPTSDRVPLLTRLWRGFLKKLL